MTTRRKKKVTVKIVVGASLPKRISSATQKAIDNLQPISGSRQRAVEILRQFRLVTGNNAT